MRKRMTRVLQVALILIAIVSQSAVSHAANANSTADPLLTLIKLSNQHMDSQTAYQTSLTLQLQATQHNLTALKQQATTLNLQTVQAEKALLPVLKFQYEAGGYDGWYFWMSLLLSSKNLEQLRQNIGYMSFVIDQQAHILSIYAEDERKLAQLERDKASVVEDIQVAQQNSANEQRLYQLALHNQPSQPMPALQVILHDEWTHTIAMQIDTILTHLDLAMKKLPDELSPSNIHIAFPNATVAISQTEFNQLLAADPALRQVKFLFRDGKVIVWAQSGPHSVLLIGRFATTANATKADYKIENVAVDGVLLSATDMKQWLAPYAFYVDVSQLHKNIKLVSVTPKNQELDLAFTISLP